MSHEALFQLSVKGVIRNSEGKILVLRAVPDEMKQVTMTEISNDLSYWDLPGGRVSTGEKPEDTLRREVHEESGIELSGAPELLVSVVADVQVTIESGTKVGIILFAYLSQLTGDQTPIISTEHDTYSWETPTAAAKLLSRNYPQALIEKLLKL